MSLAYAIQSCIFGCRSLERFKEGNDIRGVIGATQLYNSVNATGVGSKLMGQQNIIGSCARGVNASFQTLKATNKAVNALSKSVDWASRNVNPLIIGAGAYKVYKSENKPKALVEEAAALSTMFLFEGAMKKHLSDIPKIKCIAKYADKVLDYCNNTKLLGKISLKGIPSIVRALVFVGGSILGYTLGQKMGKKVTAKIEEAAVANQNKVNETLETPILTQKLEKAHNLNEEA